MLTNEDKDTIITEICDFVEPVIYIHGQAGGWKKFYGAMLLDVEADVDAVGREWTIHTHHTYYNLLVFFDSPDNPCKVDKESDPDFIEQIKQAIQLGKL